MQACMSRNEGPACMHGVRWIDRDRNTAAARSDQQLMGVLCVSMEGRPHMLVPQQLLARERERAWHATLHTQKEILVLTVHQV